MAINQNLKKKFIPLLSVLENEEFSEILNNKVVYLHFFIRELMAANLIIMCAITHFVIAAAYQNTSLIVSFRVGVICNYLSYAELARAR